MDFDSLVKGVLNCGSEALTLQRGIARNHKHDGSIITEADHAVDALLISYISESCPDAAIISEESEGTTPGTNGSWTFVIDPIDGTDAYSQGFPGWCIALGILGADLQPVGAVIYAPRWSSFGEGETLLILEPGKAAECNGRTLAREDYTGSISKRLQIMVSSRIHRIIDLSSFNGKIRTTGSAILHLVSPLLYREISASIQAPCYIWDMVAAHAILESQGYDLEYLSGGRPDYQKLIHRGKTPEVLLSGTYDDIDVLKGYITSRDRKGLPRAHK